MGTFLLVHNFPMPYLGAFLHVQSVHMPIYGVCVQAVGAAHQDVDVPDEGTGHEATDTWLPNAPVSQATGHCHAKFNQFLVLCINHDWNVPLCTCSQVCSAYETPIL